MTQRTDRDLIWSTALALREETTIETWPTERECPREFGAPEVERRLPADANPSSRTVRDTLATMRDLGHLQHATTVGAPNPGRYVRRD